MIPIKPEKIKKVASRTIKSGDEDYDIIRRMTCDLYISCQSMVASYDIFRRATMGDDYFKIASLNSSASTWFAKPENQSYITMRKAEIYKFGFDEYCKMKNIENTDFKAIEDKRYDELADRTPSEIRRDNQIVLQKIIDESADDIVVLSATKQLMDLNDAKYKDKGVELSDTDKLIHFYLPAPICDNCPNRMKGAERFKDLPDIDLGLDE